MSKENKSISLGRHGSFYIRENWLKKGLNKVSENPNFFSKNIDQVEELGIGSNMVDSLKYWLKTTELISECKSGSSGTKYSLSYLGDQVMKHDPYLEYDGTYAILHYNICKNELTATTWNWFFNHFNKKEFTKSVFISHYKDYINKHYDNTDVSDAMLDKEFGCFIKTYSENKLSIKENNYEDKINSPFACLKLIKTKKSEDSNRELYIKNYSDDKNMEPEIMGYIIINHFGNSEKNNSEIPLQKIYNLIGNLFQIEKSLILELIERLCKIDKVKNKFSLIQRADINNLNISNQITSDDLLKAYYERVKE